MRPGQQNKRGRGRGNNGGGGNGGGGNPNNNNNNNFNRKGGNPLTRTYDSSGPDVKIRGTAQHIAEKYTTLARDAQSSGDRVIAENYLQHAEHYYRIIAAAQAQMQDRYQRDDRQDFQDRDGNERDMDDGDGGEMDDQPIVQQHQSRNDRQDRNNNGNRHSGSQQHAAPAEQQPAPVAAAEPAEEASEPAPVQAAQPARQPREPRAPRPAPAVIDGTGPQPVIEGTPAEVAIEEAQGAQESQQPRRRAAGRPRRPRRTEGEGSAEGEVTLVEAASE